MHFHNMIFMAMPEHKNTAPGVMKLTILVDASYVIISFVLSMPGSRGEDF